MKNPVILLAALAFASCAPPKAIVIEEAPVEKTPPAAAPEKPAALADDGLRLPDDILALPEDSQLRSAAVPEKSEATIIASPPTE